MPDANEQPALTRAQVREVDRRAIEQYAIPGIVLMENAARNAAAIILDAATSPGPVAIVCGRGANGGDGFAIARHLSNTGRDVELFLACDAARLACDAATNHEIVRRMGLRRHDFHSAETIASAEADLHRATLIIDAVLGTGFSGNVRPPFDAVIAAINGARGVTVIAIDVPSGLDCDTGRASNATVRADKTVTFVARKTGFNTPEAAAYTGHIHVADIGAPRTLIREVLG